MIRLVLRGYGGREKGKKKEKKENIGMVFNYVYV